MYNKSSKCGLQAVYLSWFNCNQPEKQSNTALQPPCVRFRCLVLLMNFFLCDVSVTCAGIFLIRWWWVVLILIQVPHQRNNLPCPIHQWKNSLSSNIFAQWWILWTFLVVWINQSTFHHVWEYVLFCCVTLQVWYLKRKQYLVTVCNHLLSFQCLGNYHAQHGWSAISCLFLDGLQLIHDNYPSSIPVFYTVLDTVRIFLGYGKINSVRSDFLEYPIQYKKVGYCWGNHNPSKNKHEIHVALHPHCVTCCLADASFSQDSSILAFSSGKCVVEKTGCEGLAWTKVSSGLQLGQWLQGLHSCCGNAVGSVDDLTALECRGWGGTRGSARFSSRDINWLSNVVCRAAMSLERADSFSSRCELHWDDDAICSMNKARVFQSLSSIMMAPCGTFDPSFLPACLLWAAWRWLMRIGEIVSIEADCDALSQGECWVEGLVGYCRGLGLGVWWAAALSWPRHPGIGVETLRGEWMEQSTGVGLAQPAGFPSSLGAVQWKHWLGPHWVAVLTPFGSIVYCGVGCRC